MNKLFSLVMLLAILAPSIADACAGHRRKPTTCSSYSNINGTTRTTCR